jgi:hypothetical protein
MSADIGILSVSNIENSITGGLYYSTNLSGFMADSLSGANITQFAMPSSLGTIASKVLIPESIAKAIKAPTYMLIRGNDDAGL